MSYTYVETINGGILDIDDKRRMATWGNGRVSYLHPRLYSAIGAAIEMTEMQAKRNYFPAFVLVEFGRTALGALYLKEELPLIVYDGKLFDAVTPDSANWHMLIAAFDPVGNGAWSEEEN